MKTTTALALICLFFSAIIGQGTATTVGSESDKIILKSLRIKVTDENMEPIEKVGFSLQFTNSAISPKAPSKLLSVIEPPESQTGDIWRVIWLDYAEYPRDLFVICDGYLTRSLKGEESVWTEGINVDPIQRIHLIELKKSQQDDGANE